MAVPAGYDIGLDSTDPADANAVRGFVLANHRQQDITPSSARRSDGDTRFQLIPSESFWSQSDFSGGYGRVTPADPTMFWSGPADTLTGPGIRASWRFYADIGGLYMTDSSSFNAIATKDWDRFYIAEGTTLHYFEPSVGGGTWSLETTLAAAPTAMVSFRDAIWIGYGTAANAQRYYPTGGSLTTPTPNFKAAALCPYLSMLFYVYQDTTTNTWRLNRYDPENTAAVPDLAILTRGGSSSDYVRALVTVGADLFIVCENALYKFTSQNGNVGTLVGPVDTWAPTGTPAGYAAAAYQGALVYSTGKALRRHQPGGGSRQIWPISPGANSPEPGGDYAGAGFAIGALATHGDYLYAVAMNDDGSTDAHEFRLLCWTGKGMHWLSQRAVATTASIVPGRALAAINRRGDLVAVATLGGTTSGSGKKIEFVKVELTEGHYLETTTTWRSSILDFGLADVDKVLARIGVRCVLPSTTGYSIAATLYVLDESSSPPAWVARSLATRTGNYSTTAGVYSFVYFSRATAPTFLVGKACYIELAITCPNPAYTSPEIVAVTAIPNPVYPVRHGFRVEIPLHTGVRLHDGNLAYADQAAVTAALAYLRGLRASSYPFTLDWIDGASYAVRCNTIQIARDTTRPNESAWRVTLDLQEISA